MGIEDKIIDILSEHDGKRKRGAAIEILYLIKEEGYVQIQCGSCGEPTSDPSHACKLINKEGGV